MMPVQRNPRISTFERRVTAEMPPLIAYGHDVEGLRPRAFDAERDVAIGISGLALVYGFVAGFVAHDQSSGARVSRAFPTRAAFVTSVASGALEDARERRGEFA